MFAEPLSDLGQHATFAILFAVLLIMAGIAIAPFDQMFGGSDGAARASGVRNRITGFLTAWRRLRWLLTAGGAGLVMALFAALGLSQINSLRNQISVVRTDLLRADQTIEQMRGAHREKLQAAERDKAAAVQRERDKADDLERETRNNADLDRSTLEARHRVKVEALEGAVDQLEERNEDLEQDLDDQQDATRDMHQWLQAYEQTHGPLPGRPPVPAQPPEIRRDRD